MSHKETFYQAALRQVSLSSVCLSVCHTHALCSVGTADLSDIAQRVLAGALMVFTVESHRLY